jgi:hypothetical protein
MTYDHDNKLMRELKQQMIRQKKEEYFKTQTDTYFNYALTGQFRKKSLETSIKSDSLVAAKTMKSYMKRNTQTPAQIDLLDDPEISPFEDLKAVEENKETSKSYSSDENN